MTILADGQLETTQSIIFEVEDQSASGTGKVTIKKITFFNTNALEQTAILHIKKRNGISRVLRQFKLLLNEGGEYLEPGETLDLDNGDVLQAITTTASAVNFVVFGSRS